MKTEQRNDWNAPYWSNEKHGNAWDRVKEAFKRDWEQTKADVSSGGKELNQQVSDTVKQAAGTEPIPKGDRPNPATEVKATWYDVEPAFRYGVASREQYSQSYQAWDDSLETKLSSEWDEKKTGKPFKDVKPYVRHAWDEKKN